MDENRPSDDEKRPAPAAAPAAPPVPPKPEPELLDIKQFMKIDLRVAKVLSAERVENADRLLRLRIDLGEEERQLVAGIAASYEAESLVGKRIVVVANLKPARIRGVESQGMLLAADLDGRPIVATFDEDIKPGTKVR